MLLFRSSTIQVTKPNTTKATSVALLNISLGKKKEEERKLLTTTQSKPKNPPPTNQTLSSTLSTPTACPFPPSALGTAIKYK